MQKQANAIITVSSIIYTCYVICGQTATSSLVKPHLAVLLDMGHLLHCKKDISVTR